VTLACGIIGGGNIAWRYDGGAWNGAQSTTHSACIDRHPETRLVAMFEPVAEARAQLAAGHPRAQDLDLPETLEAFLDLDLDLVTIASPSEHHAAQIAACQDAGIPRLWIEKPVTLSLADYRRLTVAHDAMDRQPRTCVNYFRRFLPQYHRLKAHLNTSTGITAVEVTYSRRLDVNGVHLLDMLGFLFDMVEPPDLDWCRPDPGGNPDFGLTLDGVPVTVLGHDLPYHAIDIRVTGAEGRLAVTRGGLDMVWEPVLPNPDYPGFFHLGPPEALPGTVEMVQAMRDGTYLSLSGLLDESTDPASTLESAYFAQALMEAVLAVDL